MRERLRPADVTFLGEETSRAPLHNATLEVFDPGERSFEYEDLLALIGERIDFVPRYRQRIRTVPGRLGMPVWVDEDDFDLRYHVRRSALPRPGSMDQLRELVARIMSRRLDFQRPLWELYFVEGLEGGRVALLSKSHQVLVDGVSTVDLGQVLLDVDPTPRHVPYDHWEPSGEPSTSGLLLDTVRESVQHPSRVFSTVRVNTDSAVRAGRGAFGALGQVAAAVANRKPHPETPLDAELCEQRRVVTVRTTFEDHRKVRRVHGGTVNDVILATVTGALRSWLMTRAESVGAGRALRALVPMSVIDDDREPTSLGSQVAGHLLDLPIGESSPVVRLHQVSYAFKAHKETGRAVAADTLADVAGFAPTTFHALGSRVAAEHQRKHFDLVITNVPGPQFPLYAAGARMVESYPIPPLLPGRALAIGVTSYDGYVHYGINADRDALPDVEVLGQCLTESLEELVDSASDARPRAPRGRTRASNPRARGRSGA
ncbi:MAG: wax ester/triacylglycerol synthase family O-acyltransferase [Nocardioides sp.]|nr:wax ester/triacylglycerol synthase family O-acyltransferase [Nocardioides sp.]